MVITEQNLTEIALASNNCVAVGAVKFCHIFCMLLQNVHLHGTTLSKTSMTDIALIGLLSCKIDQKKKKKLLLQNSSQFYLNNRLKKKKIVCNNLWEMVSAADLSGSSYVS